MKKGVVFSTIARLKKLLPATFKKRAIWVVIFLAVNAVLELVSLGALIPFFIAIVKEDSFDSGWLAELYQFSGLESETSFVIVLGIIIFLFVLLKNLMGLAIVKYQANFSFGLYVHFATKLQRHAYLRGFSYLSGQNSNIVFRDINTVSLSFAQTLVLPLLNLLTEMIVISLIIVGILLYDLRAVLLLVFLVPVFMLFYRVVRQKIVNMSLEVNELHAETSKNLFQSIFGYVDVVMTNNEKWFFDSYRKNVERLKQIRSWQFIYNLMPSKVIESAVILAVLLIMIYGFTFLESKTELVMLLGVLGVAAYRVIPSINRMMMALMNVRSYQYTIDVVERAKEKSDSFHEPTRVEPLKFEEGMVVEDIGFRYPNGDQDVLTSVQLHIRKGECVGIIGKSGSGKTTLMNLMLGFLDVTKGRILVDGIELSKENIRSWRETAGYVRQEVFIVDGTLAENVALGYEVVDRERVNKVVKQASLLELVDELPGGIDAPIGERGSKISGGQRQRIGIARALYSGSKVLFFDEATSALDTQTEQEITEAIHHLSGDSVTIVIVAHRHSTLKYCNRIYEIKKGRITNIHNGIENLSH